MHHHFVVRQSAWYSPCDSAGGFSRCLLHDQRLARWWMWFILHALSAVSEALKHMGPWKALFALLCLESVGNFSGRDIFSEEIDHNALFHALRYLLFTHESSNSQTGCNPRVEVVAPLWLVYRKISAGHTWTTLYTLNFCQSRDIFAKYGSPLFGLFTEALNTQPPWTSEWGL
jgi:hypothetical protein